MESLKDGKRIDKGWYLSVCYPLPILFAIIPSLIYPHSTFSSGWTGFASHFTLKSSLLRFSFSLENEFFLIKARELKTGRKRRKQVIEYLGYNYMLCTNKELDWTGLNVYLGFIVFINTTLFYVLSSHTSLKLMILWRI